MANDNTNNGTELPLNTTTGHNCSTTPNRVNAAHANTLQTTHCANAATATHAHIVSVSAQEKATPTNISHTTTHSPMNVIPSNTRHTPTNTTATRTHIHVAANATTPAGNTPRATPPRTPVRGATPHRSTTPPGAPRRAYRPTIATGQAFPAAQASSTSLSYALRPPGQSQGSPFSSLDAALQAYAKGGLAVVFGALAQVGAYRPPPSSQANDQVHFAPGLLNQDPGPSRAAGATS